MSEILRYKLVKTRKSHVCFGCGRCFEPPCRMISAAAVDTYKIGTVANSCSTMHKIAAKEFTLENFSHEHLMDEPIYVHDGLDSDEERIFSTGLLNDTIFCLNVFRKKFLETKDKKYWWQMIQLLPSSYNQRRTVMLNYEVLANIYKSRKNHKLDEWSVGFMEWIESLPYSELITGEEKK